MNTILLEFENIINVFPKQILDVDTKNFDSKHENKWSKKEILGHLIDSSIINYLRFIKAQFEENTQLFYDQDNYCKYANYKNSDILQLTNLWASLNKQLLFLFQQVINNDTIHKKCNDETLEFLMQDYVKHLKHHMNQILL